MNLAKDLAGYHVRSEKNPHAACHCPILWWGIDRISAMHTNSALVGYCPVNSFLGGGICHIQAAELKAGLVSVDYGAPPVPAPFFCWSGDRY